MGTVSEKRQLPEDDVQPGSPTYYEGELPSKKIKLSSAEEDSSTDVSKPTRSPGTTDLTDESLFELTGDERRDKVRELLLKYIRPKLSEDELEPGILAMQIEQAFFQKYGSMKEGTAKLRSIVSNLKDAKNTRFRPMLLRGEFSPGELPTISHEDIASQETIERRQEVRLKAMESSESDWLLRHGESVKDGVFTCGKCKNSKTIIHQRQIRSADEPMTTFILCVHCGNRWKN